MAGRLFGWLDVDEREGAALMHAHPEAWTSPGTAFDYYAAHPERYQEITGRPFVEGGAAQMPPEPTAGAGGSAPALP